MHAILDMRSGERKLYLGAVDSVKIIPKEGTKVFDLLKSESGHLMLPVTNYSGHAVHSRTEKITENLTVTTNAQQSAF